MKSLALILTVVALGLLSCSKEGCTDPEALNYDSEATDDNGGCSYKMGCMDVNALNYDPEAQVEGSCEYPGSVVFFASPSQNPDCGGINILIKNIQVAGRFTDLISETEVDCGAEGGVTLTDIAPGEYEYEANGDGGCTWFGTINISSAGCTTEQILP